MRACPYVFIDGIYLKRLWGGSFENVAVMVAASFTPMAPSGIAMYPIKA